MDKKTLTQSIKSIAAESGFNLAGIAPADPEPKDIEFWKEWLGKGHHGEMAYLENPKRASIRHWYPQAKSVLVAGLFYEPQTAQPAPNEGRLASYATYPDYHKPIEKRLNLILKKIQALEPKTEGRSFVDANPVLERPYSRLSGMGWIGKNTMLIHKKMGSYFFLGGMALNLELIYDAPELDHCGSCTRCIDACPTEALKPYQMDATRCIAYLTIEKKSLDISMELQKKMGSWIFGCDICQEVCPFNRSRIKNKETSEETWKPVIPNTLDLEKALSLNEQEFRSAFKGTPVLRAKWQGLLRNATIAKANKEGIYV